MPGTPAGYVALTADGTDLAPSSLEYVLWLVRGLNEVPSVRGSDDVVPRRTGRIARARFADALPLELEGWIMAQGTSVADVVANFRDTVQVLQALFDPAGDPIVLEATLEDGSVQTINARVLPPILIEEKVASHVARVSIALESVDPAWVVSPS